MTGDLRLQVETHGTRTDWLPSSRAPRLTQAADDVLLGGSHFGCIEAISGDVQFWATIESGHAIARAAVLAPGEPPTGPLRWSPLPTLNGGTSPWHAGGPTQSDPSSTAQSAVRASN